MRKLMMFDESMDLDEVIYGTDCGVVISER